MTSWASSWSPTSQTPHLPPPGNPSVHVEVLHVGDVLSDLLQVAARVTSDAFLRKCGILARVYLSGRESETVRNALVRAFDPSRPGVRNVTDLATEVGAFPEDLRAEWRRTHVRPRRVPLLHFLILGRLLRAVVLKAIDPGASWAWIAREQGVVPKTLSRNSQRYLKRPLSELELADLPAAALLLRDAIIEALPY